MIHLTIQNKKIPALGFGTWQLEGAAGQAAIEKALEVGYRHLDCAPRYENEAEVGAAIAASGVKRADLFITTKIWMTNVRDGDLQKSADASLRDLKTDYADLLLIHWPVPEVPFTEQSKALRQVQDAGKAKLIGLSNFTVPQMKEIVEKLGAPVAANQVEYHPFLSQRPVLDYVRAHGMFLTAYAPLAHGKVNEDPVIKKIAVKHGKTPGQVALRWLVQQDRVAAIPRTKTESRMRENFDIFDFALDAGDMKDISSLSRANTRLFDPDWAPGWDRAA